MGGVLSGENQVGETKAFDQLDRFHVVGLFPGQGQGRSETFEALPGDLVEQAALRREVVGGRGMGDTRTFGLRSQTNGRRSLFPDDGKRLDH